MLGKLFDFNHDRKLSIFEKAARDAVFLSWINEENKRRSQREEGEDDSDPDEEYFNINVEKIQPIPRRTHSVIDILIKAGFDPFDLKIIGDEQLLSALDEVGFTQEDLEFADLSELRRALVEGGQFDISIEFVDEIAGRLIDAGFSSDLIYDMDSEKLLEELEDNGIDVYHMDMLNRESLIDALRSSIYMELEEECDAEDEGDYL